MQQNNKIHMTINNQKFSLTLYDNETANEFKNRLPLTIQMNELNGNEKYFYSENSFPTNSKVPSSINCGDLKLFGDNCIVLFYDDFKTSYSYTDIGYVDNVDDLKQTLGKNNVSVVFEK